MAMDRRIELACSTYTRVTGHEAYRDGMTAVVKQLKENLDYRLNEYLCTMKVGYDDSVVGFNEAWDIIRDAFK